jgi:hypothetical protein
MDTDLTEEERERLRRVTIALKVASGILLKWSFLFVLAFAGLFAGFSWFLVQRAAQSPWRYSSTTRLLYMPREGGKVPVLGDKQLLRVLERLSLKRQVGEDLPLPPGERARLGLDLEIKQESKPTNLYTLTAHSGSREAAIRKVNAYADVLIEEYGSQRLRELARWGGAAEIRKAAMRSELAKVEAELADLKIQSGTEHPVEALVTMTSMIGENRRNALMLDVEVSAAEKTRAVLEEGQGELGTALLARAPELKKLKASMEELDDEIAKLRQVYTDLNPKVRGKLEDREELEKKYQAIVAECGGEDPGLAGVEQAEKAQMSLLDATSRLEALKEQRESFAEKMARDDARAEALSEIAPRVAVLAARRSELKRELEEMEEQLGNLTYLQKSAGTDLRQIERSEAAGERSPFRAVNFAMAAGAAGGGTAALAFLTVLLGFWLGRVRGAKELAAPGDIRVLGSLPGRWAMRKRREQEALGVVAIHFVDAPESKGTVLVCRLKGAKPQPKFEEALDWSLSMAGVRPFVLTIVPPSGKGVPKDEEAVTMLNTVRKGPKGWFPVVNRYSLAPTELQMLRADLAGLREEFDCIFVETSGGLRHGGAFTEQLLGVCDAALLAVGANRTRRSELAYVRRLVQAAGKPMMGLVTGARGRVVRKELEESQW